MFSKIIKHKRFIIVTTILLVFLNIYFFFIYRRANLQKGRVVIFTDEIFYEQCVKNLQDNLADKLKDIGYRLSIHKVTLEKISINDSSKINNYFETLLNENDATLCLFSPFMTAVYKSINFDKFDCTQIHYKPIVVGLSDIEYDNFDFIYKLDNNILLKENNFFDTSKNNLYLVYYSANLLSYSIKENSFFRDDETYNISGKESFEITDFLSNKDYKVITCAIPMNVNFNKVDLSKIIIPYYLSYFYKQKKGYYILMPDLFDIITRSIDKINTPESRMKEIKYIIRKKK